MSPIIVEISYITLPKFMTPITAHKAGRSGTLVGTKNKNKNILPEYPWPASERSHRSDL